MSGIYNNVSVGDKYLYKSPVNECLCTLIRMLRDEVVGNVLGIINYFKFSHYLVNKLLRSLKSAGVLDSYHHGNLLVSLGLNSLVEVLVNVIFLGVKRAEQTDSLSANLELEELRSALLVGLVSPAHTGLNALEGKDVILKLTVKRLGCLVFALNYVCKTASATSDAELVVIFVIEDNASVGLLFVVVLVTVGLGNLFFKLTEVGVVEQGNIVKLILSGSFLCYSLFCDSLFCDSLFCRSFFCDSLFCGYCLCGSFSRSAFGSFCLGNYVYGLYDRLCGLFLGSIVGGVRLVGVCVKLVVIIYLYFE